jgi:hypothetical protein
MEKWQIRFCRAASMGVGWGAAWVPIFGSAGPLIEPLIGLTDEPWLIASMLAGFPCGAVFATLAGTASERLALDQLPVGRAASTGAVSGLLVGLLWLAVVLLSEGPSTTKWLFEGGVVGCLTLLSAVSGIGTALLARLGQDNPGAHAA